ncbi:outer membrane protein assembly factor BamA [Sulfurimonas sp. MAG313]|nr:outer membrane protein assembly factor BamA [Sulfurimonas sp. MAG313]MDF1880994.1 outer membrane protein assembly factor BamA [Sulfurimonas sp. MAG313]
MRFLFLTLVLSVILLQAKIVNDIQFDGLVHLSHPVALESLGFEVGDRLSEKKIDQSIKRFFKFGYFTDIYVSEENGVLIYHFAEKSIISRIDVQGYGDFSEEDSIQLLNLKKGTLYDKKKLQKAKKRLIEVVAQEGYIDTIVEVEVTTLDNGSISLVFKVKKGENIIIEKMSFEGMTVFEPEDFNEVIANKEHQWMGWFWGRNDGEMKLTDLQYDPLRMRDLYMQHGYLDSKIDDPFVRVDFSQYVANMAYTVHEGEEYTVNDIVLEQEVNVIENEVIREVIQLQVNQAFNIKTFREDSDRVKTIIANLGYAYVKVSPDLRKNKENHTVDVIYKIRPGKKVFIRDVLISGNTRTLDRITRREIYLAPGDLYSLTDIRDSRNSLQRTGYFESTTIEEQRIDENTMDLIVKVKETQTGNIQLGGGYGSFGGILLSASISDRNIFGSGINMGFSTETSERTKSFSINVSNQRLNDSDFSGSSSVYINETIFTDYTIATKGIGLGLGRRLTRFLSGSLNYTYAASAYSDIASDTNLTNVDQILFEDYEKSAVTIGVSFNNTDDFYVPRNGIVARASLEYAGLGGTSEFIKSNNTFKIYKGLEEYVGFDLILRYKTRISHIFYDDQSKNARTNLPTAERFYMGGVGSLRGYESYSLSPRDGLGRRIGGRTMFTNAFELNFPLLPSAKLRLSAFYDYGWLRGYGQNLGDDPTVVSSYFEDKIARSSYGLAVEWHSPMGPIQLIFSDPVDAQPGDRTASFEFTIGQNF